MKNKLGGLKNFALKHRILSLVILAVFAGGIFLAFSVFGKSAAETKYVLAKAERGTIVSSLSSSGQVAAYNSVDIKAKTSGEVVYIGVKPGDNVTSGQLIAKLDTTDAQKTIRDAEQNLRTSQISLQKMQGDAALAVPKNKQDAQDQLAKDYESGFNSVANAFIDLPAIMTDLDNILYDADFNNYQKNIDFYTYSANTYNSDAPTYKDSADASYKTAKASYDKNFNNYKSVSRFSDQASIDSIILETYQNTKNIAQAIKDASNLIQFYKNTFGDYNIKPDSRADTNLSTLNSDLGKVNSAITNLLNAQNTIKSDKDSISNADLDLESQKLSLTKAQNSLTDAKTALADYYVYAPFDGIISSVTAKLGETASGSVASIVTKTMMAEISFGETDIAKIKIDQKATLAFDALPDLTITGKVSSIDVVGTSSQGVVSYNVKVVMDVQDSSIKPGMSTTATIITNTKTDVLYVPNSAIKTQQGVKYILKVSDTINDYDLDNSAGVTLKTNPARQTVETGLSDDSSTEITSGLSEGDIIVSKTVSSATTTKTSTTGSGSKTSNTGNVRIPGLGG